MVSGKSPAKGKARAQAGTKGAASIRALLELLRGCIRLFNFSATVAQSLPAEATLFKAALLIPDTAISTARHHF